MLLLLHCTQSIHPSIDRSTDADLVK